jgi:cysteinyl-tRNA synthetase
MHNGFVNVDSEKMSKSLGNFFTIRCELHTTRNPPPSSKPLLQPSNEPAAPPTALLYRTTRHPRRPPTARHPHRDVLNSYHPLALRWFLVATHYRAPVNYTQRALEEASDRVYYVFQTVADAEAAVAAGGDAGAAAAAQAAEDTEEGRGEGAALMQAVR